jgi:hypothetical protein
MLAPTARRCTPPPVMFALAGVAAACSLMPAVAGATEGPPSCAPSGVPATNVARALHADGTSELTEFGQGGGYRVTRCGKDGRALVSQTVSPIVGADGGTVLVPTERIERGVTVAMLYGDPSDPRWAAEFRSSQAAIAAQVIPPTVPADAPPVALPLPVAAADPVGTPKDTGTADAPRNDRPKDRPVRPGIGNPVVSAAVAGDACTNSQFNLWETAWGTRNYSYYVNRSRFNYNDTSVGSIVDGHVTWDTTSNSCGLNDITNLTSHHLGSTSETIHTFSDGRSVTDKGDLSSICPGALACTWLFSDAAGHTTETDQRYNEDFTFTNVGAAGAYDYESISAHETGHSIGLDHANSSNALTMYFQITAGTTYARSLAKGDVLGLRARYP